MAGNMMVYAGSGGEVQDEVARAVARPIRLDVHEVDVVEAGQSVAGEVWSPQLLPFRPWERGGARAAGAGAQSAPGDAGAGAPGAAGASVSAVGGGTDGDLLVVGARGMGISDEERERLLAAAKHDEGVGGAAAVAVPLRRTAGGERRAVAVRRDEGGYALVAFDLRRLAEEAGCAADLVVAVPAYVGDVPIVRIAAEAFARRFVQGVGVRVLVVPDTVERIGAGAFAALPGRHIHLGAGVRSGGDQPCDLASVSPRLERRTYSVSEGNAQYAARDGSLFSRDGAQLLFLAPPYAREASLPEGIERVGEAALCAGCEPPHVVRAGAALARVESKAWDGAVWVCPPAAPVRRLLRKRGVRLAGPQVTERGGCWYDFCDEGAVLVAGPPAPKSPSARFAALAAQLRIESAADAEALLSADDARTRADANDAHGQVSGGTLAPVSAGPAAAAVQAIREGGQDVLELPREVGGRPLVRIASGALPNAPHTLIVPDTVREVGDGNLCKGTKRLVLPEGLRRIGRRCFCSRTLEGPVPIPASVRSVGEGSFEYAVCLLGATGDVVHVSADQLLSCFAEDAGGEAGAGGAGAGEGADPAAAGRGLFDFERYDDILRQGKNLPDRLGAVLHRLAAPHGMAPAVRDALVAQLRDVQREAQQRIAREGDRAMVAALVDAGFIDGETFARQIELLRACNRTDCVAYLMEWHREQAEGSAGDAGAAGGPAAGAPAARQTARQRFAL